MRAPVDDALAAIDEPLFIKAAENLAHGFIAALVKCEALSLPVAGTAELFELAYDACAVFFFPHPCTLKELITPYICLCEPLMSHLLHYFGLGGD